MQFKYKLAASLAAFALLMVAVFAVQYIYLNQAASSSHDGYRLDETFTAQDLTYGPQGVCVVDSNEYHCGFPCENVVCTKTHRSTILKLLKRRPIFGIFRA